ncbi:hypothetical protein ACH5RR_021612 [Cinchona calisaya]|uniref:Uncharacterized protein n=1 Tax=Cinchona calisaya TaxID=153742 RepID=A0ABD2ZJ30_9GENT
MNDGDGDKDNLTQEAPISDSNILVEQISNDQAKAFLEHTPQPDFEYRDDTSMAQVNNLLSAFAQQLQEFSPVMIHQQLRLIISDQYLPNNLKNFNNNGIVPGSSH